MGILVEDFLSSVSEVSQIDKKYPLIVLYDTTVLLRCLGCSGRLLKTASDELTRYLQDIGCQIRFLAGNESEVSNVISTILIVRDTGGELEGETADAISRGEESIDRLRMLNNNFVGHLAQMNIFAFEEGTITPGSASYQISEPGFARFLQQESQRRGRGYGQQNRENDAGYLATVMRLRGGSKSRDFASSRVIFVTTNRLLATASRRFLVSEGQLTQAQCPPIRYFTQVATIAWLLKDQKLSPDIAERELLINCYAAARPDAAWFRYFREGIEQVVGDMEEFGRDPQNSLVLQAARRIAQEEGLSTSAIMQELNAAEIIDRSREYAAEERSKILDSHAAEQKVLLQQHETERAEQIRRHAKELDEAEKRTSARVQLGILENLRDTNTRRIMWGIELALVAAFVSLFFLDSLDTMREHMWVGRLLKLVLGSVAGIHFLDLIGVKFVSRRFGRLHMWIARKQERRLAKRLKV